jgi:hypothetical protein
VLISLVFRGGSVVHPLVLPQLLAPRVQNARSRSAGNPRVFDVASVAVLGTTGMQSCVGAFEGWTEFTDCRAAQGAGFREISTPLDAPMLRQRERLVSAGSTHRNRSPRWRPYSMGLARK